MCRYTPFKITGVKCPLRTPMTTRSRVPILHLFDPECGSVIPKTRVRKFVVDFI